MEEAVLEFLLALGVTGMQWCCWNLISCLAEAKAES